MDAVEFVFGWKNNDQKIFLISTRSGDTVNGQIAVDVLGLTFLKKWPRIAAFLGKDKYTHELVLKSGIFSACLLSQEQNGLVERFGMLSGREAEKFKGIDYKKSRLGNPIIPGCTAWFDCLVLENVDLGDHTAFVGLVKGSGFEGTKPLTVSFFLEKASEKTLSELDRMTKKSTGISERFFEDYAKRKGLK